MADEAPAERAEEPVVEGGEAVCWLPLVCFECGKVREKPHADTCEHCGAPVDT